MVSKLCSNKSKKSKAIVVYRAPQAKKTAAKRSRRANASGMNESCVKELARSVADPWRISSCVPDGAHGVGKFSIKQTTQLTTGAAGGCCGVYLSCSDTQNYINADFGSASTTPTVPGGNPWTAATQNASILALYARTRFVSGGIKVSFCGATATDQGSLLVGQVPAGIAASSFNGLTLGAASALCQYSKVVPLRNGAKITWRPCDYDDQGAFIQTGAAANLNSTSIMSRPWIFAIIYGAAASSVPVLLETVTNWEGQYRDPTFSPGGINETAGSTPAVVGWFEKFQNVIKWIEPIAPLFMAGNGYETPRLMTSSQRGKGSPKIEELD